VLEGAERVLRDHRPVLLVESEKRHNAAAPESIHRFLADRGYAGFFLKRGRPFGIAAFDAANDQREENVVGNVKSATNPYINNFIFVPG